MIYKLIPYCLLQIPVTIESLPVEILDDIFEQVREYLVARRKFFTHPLSRKLAPHIRKNLYQQIRLFKPRKVNQLLNTIANSTEHGPLMDSLVIELQPSSGPITGLTFPTDFQKNSIDNSWEPLRMFTIDMIESNIIHQAFQKAVNLKELCLFNAMPLTRLILTSRFANDPKILPKIARISFGLFVVPTTSPINLPQHFYNLETGYPSLQELQLRYYRGEEDSVGMASATPIVEVDASLINLTTDIVSQMSKSPQFEFKKLKGSDKTSKKLVARKTSTLRSLSIDAGAGVDDKNLLNFIRLFPNVEVMRFATSPYVPVFKPFLSTIQNFDKLISLALLTEGRATPDQFIDNHIAPLKTLAVLILSGNTYSDNFFEELHHLTKLKCLFFSYPSTTPAIFLLKLFCGPLKPPSLESLVLEHIKFVRGRHVEPGVILHRPYQYGAEDNIGPLQPKGWSLPEWEESGFYGDVKVAKLLALAAEKNGIKVDHLKEALNVYDEFMEEIKLCEGMEEGVVGGGEATGDNSDGIPDGVCLIS